MSHRVTGARRFLVLERFYVYGPDDTGVRVSSPTASARRPRVCIGSAIVTLAAEHLRGLLAAAAVRSALSGVLVAVLTFCGLRICEALDTGSRT